MGIYPCARIGSRSLDSSNASTPRAWCILYVEVIEVSILRCLTAERNKGITLFLRLGVIDS